MHLPKMVLMGIFNNLTETNGKNSTRLPSHYSQRVGMYVRMCAMTLFIGICICRPQVRMCVCVCLERTTFRFLLSKGQNGHLIAIWKEI